MIKIPRWLNPCKAALTLRGRPPDPELVYLYFIRKRSDGYPSFWRDDVLLANNGTLLIYVIQQATEKTLFFCHSTQICERWYWHFMDVVWLFLFVSIYRWDLGFVLDVSWVYISGIMMLFCFSSFSETYLILSFVSAGSEHTPSSHRTLRIFHVRSPTFGLENWPSPEIPTPLFWCRNTGSGGNPCSNKTRGTVHLSVALPIRVQLWCIAPFGWNARLC